MILPQAQTSRYSTDPKRLKASNPYRESKVAWKLPTLLVVVEPRAGEKDFCKGGQEADRPLPLAATASAWDNLVWLLLACRFYPKPLRVQFKPACATVEGICQHNPKRSNPSPRTSGGFEGLIGDWIRSLGKPWIWDASVKPRDLCFSISVQTRLHRWGSSQCRRAGPGSKLSTSCSSCARYWSACQC
jgi:hypothetical protein